MSKKAKKTSKSKLASKAKPSKKPSSVKSPGSKASSKLVYYFGGGKAEGGGTMKSLLGGKGANLAEMTRIGLPVPPGFTITTEVCTYYYDNKRTYPKALKAQVREAVEKMEKNLNKKLGNPSKPLLVAVRSGSRESMPGMMDTILNLGLNDATVAGLAKLSNNERFAYDCYRRFVQMYGDVVMGVQKRAGEEHEPFETAIEELKNELFPNEHEVEDTRLDAAALKELVRRFKKLVHDRTGKDFPSNPWDQLDGAVGAVFNSWMNDRAIVYRRKYNIPSEWGTAINVQAMVFGNTGNDSGSGVAFTRDPANGEKVFYGEFLINAQGEDVVAGVRTPEPVKKLNDIMPKSYAELEKVRKTLEAHFRDMQDFEFTIEEGKLFMLQTRNGKRTGLAALRIAAEMVKEKLITTEEAVRRIPADSLSQVLAPIFDAEAVTKAELLSKGLPAGPGAASGKIYFNAERAVEAAERGEKVLLVRVETSPEDLRGMIAAEGILTARGGVSSHAALVARQMGKVCVCGAADLLVDYDKLTLTVKGRTFKAGDFISIDGTTGEIFAGQVKTAPSEVIQVLLNKTLKPSDSYTFQVFNQLMTWADKYRKLAIRTNADQPDQVENAISFGAEGIGLCRTEHMFFEGDRINSVREMILATNLKEREHAIAKLLPFQREDFVGLFKSLKGLPATIRLLDPPLHEFLPHEGSMIREVAEKLGKSADWVHARVAALHEANPMLGHRGCRLGITYPEISEMQARAIFEAAAEVQKKGIKVKPEVMIPLVGFPKELELQLEIVHRIAKQVGEEQKVKFDYMVGTMIEIPRAALIADEIAKQAEFFSFGTNDLTQTTLGMSRDDAGSFLPQYQELDIVKNNPFASIDQTGVGKLMKIGIEGGRATRPNIKIGICGEHGGEPSSVKFCHKLGLSYVSCSPFRVPIARLAAAQAALEEASEKKSANKKSAKKK
ncbi:MAG: pyruvate, phosphate dikinase [Verrucomicrobiota bacterium]|nr:pyruvate, phosphate dikinase [Verrucomicrobiota bacterium]